MSIFRSPRLEEYWNNKRRSPVNKITRPMSVNWFQHVNRYLQICGSSGDTGKSFFFNKVEPALKNVVKNSKHLWILAHNFSADEMMVMNFGRSTETVKIRNKPIGSGIKIWALWNSGYLFYAYTHSNSQLWRDCGAYKRQLSQFPAVVARLFVELPRCSQGRTERPCTLCTWKPCSLQSSYSFSFEIENWCCGDCSGKLWRLWKKTSTKRIAQ